MDESTVAPSVALLPMPVEPPPMMPGRNGGKLRRGGPRKLKSALARHILEAATPQAARQLAHMALTGTVPGKDVPIAVQDRLKALDAVLARGGVPIRTEITGADGAPFTVLLGAAAHAD